MSSVTDLARRVDVVIGVDTHIQTHTAVMIDAGTGAVIARLTIDTTAAGYERLVAFVEQQAAGASRAWALEGTGTHGAGLARYLDQLHEYVLELDRADRARRRGGRKSDELDAERAAREALSRKRVGTPRCAVGDRQGLSVLLSARRSATNQASDTARQIRGLLIAAPEKIRDRYRALSSARLITALAASRVPRTGPVEIIQTKTVLRALARRVIEMRAEAREHRRQIARIVRSWRPDLLERRGVGPIVAATLLCAWSHPGRIHTEAAFAMLAGVAPIEATSGQTTTRHRLNRGGDRQLNCAIHTIAINRLRTEERSQNYRAKRTADGKNPKEITRCLKRFITREIFHALQNPPNKQTQKAA